MSTANVNALAPAPIIMWWDGGERAITAREKARIEEHGPSCFSIALVPATPSARWAADGLPDPHAGRYACERAALTLGNLTDDELANAVYLHGNEQPSMADLVAGKALSGIVYLTAAKERIRWLSRALEATCKQPLQVGEVQGDALDVEQLQKLISRIHSTVSLGHQTGPHAYAGEDFGRYLAEAAGDCREIMRALAAVAARQPRAPVAWLIHWSHIPLEAPEVTTSASRVDAVSALTDPPRIEPLYAAAPAQGIDLVPRPMDTAPRDGTMVRLLVRFIEHSTEDTTGPAWTIGANNGEHDGGDLWCFAGWCWTHDHFTEGKGTPVGWLPLIDGQRDAAPGVANA